MFARLTRFIRYNNAFAIGFSVQVTRQVTVLEVVEELSPPEETPSDDVATST